MTQISPISRKCLDKYTEFLEHSGIVFSKSLNYNGTVPSEGK